MTFQPPPDPKDPKKVSNIRLTLWIVVGGAGVYSILQGVFGLLNK